MLFIFIYLFILPEVIVIPQKGIIMSAGAVNGDRKLVHRNITNYITVAVIEYRFIANFWSTCSGHAVTFRTASQCELVLYRELLHRPPSLTPS